MQRRIYSSLEDCESGNSTSFFERFLPNDPNLCIPWNYVVDDFRFTRRAGSARTYCQGTQLTTQFFSDAHCSEQSFDVDIRENIVGECRLGDHDALEGYDFLRYGTTCGETPQFYCRDFAQAGLGTKVEILPPFSPITKELRDAYV